MDLEGGTLRQLNEGASMSMGETIVEFGVNEMTNGVGHNPFESNFESQDLAEAAGRNYLIENQDVPSVVIFELTIQGNTIVDDQHLLTIERADLTASEVASATVDA